MLAAYAAREGLPLCDCPPDAGLDEAQWIDLLDPTEEEKARAAAASGLTIASEADLSAIETSSRLAYDGRAIYLSMPLVAKMEGEPAIVRPMGFALDRETLITIRFHRSRAFENFLLAQHRAPMATASPVDILILLLEAISDRLADILEGIRDELDGISKHIFQETTMEARRKAPGHPKHGTDLKGVLQALGRAADLSSNVRDSLLGVGRILPFLAQAASGWIDRAMRDRMKSLRQDIVSLSDYENHLNQKIQFLLDATLGLINNTQANIIKVMTVVSVVGVPPTLIASIYGMNFKGMPELDWSFGYPYGLTMIALSAILPLLWFKRRGWL
ncbi:magnesium transporter CorA family protein [Acidisoma sp. C75]